jgi:uncharacterized repeat protein (TIGR02543 family)
MKTKLQNCRFGTLHLVGIFFLLASIELCKAQSGYLRNESGSNPFDASVKKVIVLIHGWNPDNLSDMYASDPWSSLISDTKQKLTGSDWQLFTFHWEQGSVGANTGPRYTFTIQDGFQGVGNSVVAAVHADQQGHNLATLLSQASHNLRRVQLIAHSAGAWVAREAAADILQSNPYVTVQVTLLDPFIPDVIPEQSTGLNDSYMSQLASVTGNDRISLLENYYASDSQTFTPTEQIFTWRSGAINDVNQRVDWAIIYYDSHGGPIEFYRDTVYQTIVGNPTPSGLYGLGCPFDYSQLGWLRSLFYTDEIRSPGIAVQPQNQSAPSGSTVSLSVTASSSHPLSYEWFLNGGAVGGATSSSYSFTLNSLSAGTYVVKIGYQDQSGWIFSDPATVAIVAPTAPAVTTVYPSSFTGLSIGQTTLIRIIGSGFTGSSTLTFNDGVNPSYTGKVPTFVSANELDYSVTTGTSQANWTVQVVNGPQTSNLGYFTVNAPSVPPTATGSLVVNLSPAGAISAGAQWQVDGTGYNSSGQVVGYLTPGSHTVSFKPISGYTTPANQIVTINANAQTTAGGMYSVITQSTYTLTLNYNPAQGGASPSPLVPEIYYTYGSYSFGYTANSTTLVQASASTGYHFTGWSGDASGSANPITVTMNGNKNITANFAAGDPNLGTLTVTIQPPEAAAAGVTWGFNESDFRASGSSVTLYPFSSLIFVHVVSGWSGAGVYPVTIVAGQTTNCVFAVSSTTGSTVGTDPRTYYTLAGLAGNTGSTDGTNSAARFNTPWHIAVDIGDNVYVADYGNHTIRKITPAGAVSTLAGLAGSPESTDGTGSAARFNMPIGVAVDTNGNVYVGEYGNSTIRKITPGGVVSSLAGLAGNIGSADGTGSAARFKNPNGVAVDTNGNVYVADYGNYTIRKITPGGAVSTIAGLAGNRGTTDGVGAAARFFYPAGIAVDNARSLYVADTFNHTIRKITSDGTVTTLAGFPGSGGAADGTGNIARFSSPDEVAVDSSGNVYVADNGNSTIRKITPAGVASTLAGLSGHIGSTDGNGSTVRFQFATGVAIDSVGNLFVADNGNSTIRATQSSATKFDQAIIFGTLSDKSAADAPFTLTASASSGLPVYLSVLSGPAFLDTNNVLTLLGGGTVTVVAWQPGDSNYNAAATVPRSFNVSKVPQTITFGALSQQKVGDAPFQLSGTSDSGLPVNFSVSGPAVLSGNIVTLTGWGTVTVSASQPGNSVYSAASTVSQSFFVAPPDNTIVNPQLSANGLFQMAFYGTVSSNYTLQASTNLTNWSSLFTFPCTNSPIMVVDTNATYSGAKFYRLQHP